MHAMKNTAVFLLAASLLGGCSGDAFNQYQKERYVEDTTGPTPDTESPAIAAVTALSRTRIDVEFSEALDRTSAEQITNYYVQGPNRIEITGAALAADGKTVMLDVAGDTEHRMLNGKQYTMLVQNVADTERNAIANLLSQFTGKGSIVAELTGTPPAHTNSAATDIHVEGAGIIAYQFSLDGGAWSGETAAGIPISLNGLSDGYHTIRIIGKDDAAGGEWQEIAQPTVFGWTVDTAAPVADLFNLPENFTDSPSAEIIVGGAQVIGYRYRLDSDPLWSDETASTVHIALDGLADAAHTLYVIARDEAGNWQDEAAATTFSWTVDSAGIAAQLSGLPSGYTSENAALVTVSGTGINAYKYRLDAGGWSAQASITELISLAALADGEHTLYVCGRRAIPPFTWQDDADATAYTWTVDTTAPAAVTLLSLPENPTSDQGVHIAVSGAGGVVQYRYKLDSGLWSGRIAIANPISLNGIEGGAHTLRVVGVDAAGNEQDAQSATAFAWTIDLDAPAALLSGTPANPTSDDAIDVLANGSDVVSYKFKIDEGGVWSEEFSAAAHIAVPGITEGAHTLFVIAKDTAGNWQAIADATAYSWSVDITPPEAELSNLPNDPTNSTSTGIIVGGTGVTAYKYRIDLEAWSAERTTAQPIARTGLAETNHTIEVIARDGAGNWQPVGAPTAHLWTINFSAPTALLSNTPSTWTQSTSIDIDVGGSGITKYKYKLDGGEWTLAWTDIATSIYYTGLAESAHTLYVRGRKDSGSEQAELNATTWTWTIDRTAPAGVLSGQPSDPTRETAISITVGGPGVVAYKYKLDNESWSSQISTATLISIPGISEATHRIYVIGRDLAGNWQSEAGATNYEWTVDLSAPSAPVTWDAGDYDGDLRLEFSWTNPAGTVEAKVQVSTNPSFTAPVYGGDDGISVGNAHNFNYIVNPANGAQYFARAKVRDAAGNWSGFGDASNGIYVTGGVTGKVKNSSGGTGIAGALVTLKRVSDDSIVSSALTDANGIFTFGNAPIGTSAYYASVSAGGFNAAIKNNITVSAGAVTDVGSVFLVSTSAAQGIITGTVVDANDGHRIAGATVVIRRWDNTIVETLTSSSSTTDPEPNTYPAGDPPGYVHRGKFESSTLDPGTYSITITMNRYFDLTADNATVAGNFNLGSQAMCEVLDEPQVRVILLWGGRTSSPTDPSDLDLHLVGPTNKTVSVDGAPNNRFHIYWSNSKSFNENTGAYIAGAMGDLTGTQSTSSLVQDDTTYFGPEAINLFRYGGNQYVYGVYTYTVHRWSANGGSWGYSPITMRVYDSQGMAREINFPSGAPSDRYWKAIKINIQGIGRANRTITVYNQFGTLTYDSKSSMNW